MDEIFDGCDGAYQHKIILEKAKKSKAKSKRRAKRRIGALPETGYVRLPQIIGDPGDPNADPPIPPTPAVIPVGKSTWWAGVKSGIYPAPIKISKRCTGWEVQAIRRLAGGKS